MKYTHLMHERKTNKSYGGTIYDDKLIDNILELAILSPSSFGSEPWEFFVIRNEGKGKELIKTLKPVMWNQKVLDNCSHLIFLLYRNQKNFVQNAQYLVDFRNKAENVTTHDKESATKDAQGFLNHIHTHEYSINAWARQQTYIALANVLNAATEFGLGSTPMEGLNFSQVKEVLKQNTNIDFELLDLSCSICIGEAIGDVLPRRRFALKDKVSYYK